MKAAALMENWRNNVNGRNKQAKNLLIEIRAKAFELQAAISDYIERENSEYGRQWLQLAESIYRGAEQEIKKGV